MGARAQSTGGRRPDESRSRAKRAESSYRGSEHQRGHNRRRHRRDQDNRRSAARAQEDATGDIKETKIAKEQLNKLTQEILDQTKQLGFYDEVRMQLLTQIESSREFKQLKDEFSREVERFCSRADLSRPRSELRDQLQARTFSDEASKLSLRLRDCIERKTARSSLRPKYEEHALSYLQEQQYVITTKPEHINSQERLNDLAEDETRTSLSGHTSPAPEAPPMIEQTDCDKEQLPPMTASCCSSSSQADSALSITPPDSCRQQESPTSLEPPKLVIGGESMTTSDALGAMMDEPAEEGEEDEHELLKGKLAVRYARRKERRMRRNENKRRFKAQLRSSQQIVES